MFSTLDPLFYVTVKKSKALFISFITATRQPWYFSACAVLRLKGLIWSRTVFFFTIVTKVDLVYVTTFVIFIVVQKSQNL